MKCYLVADEFKQEGQHPRFATVWSNKQQEFVDLDCSVLLFSERRSADRWARSSNQLVHEIELNVM